jgi:regulator of cell morphogenesis and NO signaling
MNPFSQSHSCGSAMMGGDQVELCEPLAQLKREHGPLRDQMNEFARLAAAIGKDEGTADWSKPLEDLRVKVKEFVDRLDPHSELEEGVLFPLMAKYIGRETGPIAVMEYEHEQAKGNLKKFLELSSQENQPLSAEQASEIASYAAKAQEVLTDHFMKEENVLFPMAETMLSPEDKSFLAGKFGHA